MGFSQMNKQTCFIKKVCVCVFVCLFVALSSSLRFNEYLISINFMVERLSIDVRFYYLLCTQGSDYEKALIKIIDKFS